jgi:hypothetical protein
MGIGIGTAMALTRRWRHRIWLALPLGIIGLGIAGPFTTGVLAVVYTAAATVWWIRRAWRLATRPRGSLPLPA